MTIATLHTTTISTTTIRPIEHQSSVSTFSKQYSILYIVWSTKQHLSSDSILQTLKKLKHCSTVIKFVSTKFQLNTPELIHITLHTCDLPQRLQLPTQLQFTIHIFKLLHNVRFQVIIL